MADRTGKACRSMAIVMLMAWPSRNIYRATKAKVVSGRAVPGNLTDRQQIVLLENPADIGALERIRRISKT